MKKRLLLLAVAAFSLMLAGCERPTPDPGPDPGPEPGPGPEPVVTLYDIAVQLVSEGANLAIEGIPMTLTDENGMATYDGTTDAGGAAAFKVPAGTYAASATYKTAEDGQRIAYNGSNSNVKVAEGSTSFKIDLNKVVSQQIIIKELYTTGCQYSAASKTYSNDAYIILYNNSDIEADASDIVFCAIAPSTAQAPNKFYGEGDVFLLESTDYIPAYSAIWWFTGEVKIPAYSQIVVAIYGAIDHTATVAESVDLSDPSYYWMCNSDISAFNNAKYTASENIPSEHYLSGAQINKGNTWVIANSCPGVYIGKMDKAQAQALIANTDAYDKTQGDSDVMAVVKFPKANVVDAIDSWVKGNAKSKARYPSDINTGHIDITNNQGYTIYRNVDKEATEALAENEGKLVYNYAGGTADIEGSTDPSGIDAEASIAAGAHIIYSDTNDTGKDFHQRKVASIKK